MNEKKAATAQTVTTSKKLNPKDTTAANQRAIVIQALRDGNKTTIELREKYGVMSPAPRVIELRALGYSILTIRVKAVTPDGVMHCGVARYVLLSEPKGAV